MIKKVKEFLLIAVGIVIIAAAMYFGMEPYNIAPGGVYGASVVISNIFDVQTGFISLILNALLFIIAFLTLGKSFGAKTLFAALGFSGSLMILEVLFPEIEPLTGDMLLDILTATTLSAVGIVIILNQGASSGGTDIIAAIINKITGIEFGKALMICDMIITAGAMAFFGIKIGLYSLFAVIAYSVTIDYILDGFNENKEMTIISSKTDEIINFILVNLNRSASIYPAIGAYSKDKRDIIVTIQDRQGFVKLKNFIKDVDPYAFITVNQTYEVLGEGYKDLNK